MDLDDEQAQALASAVRDARRQLRRSQAQVATAGGISVATVGRVERAESRVLEEDTLFGFDDGLEWQRGSAERVVEGGSPLPKDVGDVRFEEFRDDSGVLRRRVVARIEPADPAAELSEAWARLNEDLARASPDVRQVVSRLAAGLLAEADDLLGTLTNVSTLTASDRPQGSPRSRD